MNQQDNHLEGFGVLKITLTVDGPWLQNGSSQFSLIKRKTRLETSSTDEAVSSPVSQGSLFVHREGAYSDEWFSIIVCISHWSLQKSTTTSPSREVFPDTTIIAA